MRKGRKLEENVVRAVYAYYANGWPGSFTYYTEEECKENVEIDSIKLELARYILILSSCNVCLCYYLDYKITPCDYLVSLLMLPMSSLPTELYT